MKLTKKMSRKEFLVTGSTALGLGFLTANSGKMHAQTRKEPALRTLGRTDLKVAGVGLGATRTMDPYVVSAALDQGVNFIDTGRHYFDGQNEVMIGKVIADKRDKIIIQSKLNFRFRSGSSSATINDTMLKQMTDSLENSLRALRTDYVDILLLHGVSNTDILRHETIGAFFSNAKEKGQIRACGFSSHSHQAELVAWNNEHAFYDVMMLAYNHKGAYTHSKTGRFSEWDQVALERELTIAHSKNLGVVAMKTCSGGLYSSDALVKPSMKEALRWILQRPFIHTMAVAMGSIDEVHEDVDAMYSI